MVPRTVSASTPTTPYPPAMSSLLRSTLIRLRLPGINGAAWAGAGVVMAMAGLIVVRACGYDWGAVAGYGLYLALYVALPGVVVMQAVNRGPLALTRVLALALPTGFAVEILSYLGCAALHVREVYPWLPLLWLGFAVLQAWSSGVRPVRWRVTVRHGGVACWLAIAFLATTLMAASQMYAESPLAQGLPTRAIFHDWVYLVSRAGVIKNNWPLDDPSLAGTPLQYHYFMMVHAAATSATTGIELTALMLRLIFVPLGAVLVAQAFLLGRAVARSPWAGVLAAVLLVVVSEVSFAPSYGEPMFLGLFVRWLFVSPTFFFGMIFCGALLIAVWDAVRARQMGPLRWLWLLLLGAAGTGAKGTVLPVILCALGLWALWRLGRERRIPWRLAGFGLVLGVGFAVVYEPTMSAWRTGDAAWRPFHVFQLSSYWKQHLPGWQQALSLWLPAGAAKTLASVACATVVFAGTCGIRLLALPYLLRSRDQRRDGLLVTWLGAFFVASAGMGALMELNSYGELYLLLMMRLPMSVLTAGFLLALARRVRAWWLAEAHPPSPRVWPRLMLGTGLTALAAVLTVQTSLWVARNRVGFQEWLKTPTNLSPDGYMQELREALLWVRQHTEPDAVLVANACTPENMKKDHWGALDRTLTGVHFYYSALSERRLWFEGPSYIMDTTRARIRANMASNFFYRSRPLAPEIIGDSPSYILHDRSLKDGAVVTLPLGARVFSNSRIDIYRLSPLTVAASAGVGLAGGVQDEN